MKKDELRRQWSRTIQERDDLRRELEQVRAELAGVSRRCAAAMGAVDDVMAAADAARRRIVAGQPPVMDAVVEPCCHVGGSTLGFHHSIACPELNR